MASARHQRLRGKAVEHGNQSLKIHRQLRSAFSANQARIRQAIRDGSGSAVIKSINITYGDHSLLTMTPILQDVIFGLDDVRRKKLVLLQLQQYYADDSEDEDGQEMSTKTMACLDFEALMQTNYEDYSDYDDAIESLESEDHFISLRRALAYKHYGKCSLNPKNEYGEDDDDTEPPCPSNIMQIRIVSFMEHNIDSIGFEDTDLTDSE